MKNKISHWISSARPHTLTLAVACTGMGNIVAANNGTLNSKIVIFSVLTALLLQILSNFANDYGDFKHGTDNQERKGPKRALQQGHLNPQQIKSAIIILSVLSLISGISLLFFSLPVIKIKAFLIFLCAGLAAIWAAYAYTASKKPYGYKGFGDIFVFIFFGLFSVAGTFFLHSGEFSFIILLPAVSIGLLSTCVLNLNNLRDYETDKKTGKITIAVRLGLKNAAIYHSLLVIMAFLCMLIYNLLIFESNWLLLNLLVFVLLIPSVKHSFNFKKPEELYKDLKQVSMAILLIVMAQLINFIF